MDPDGEYIGRHSTASALDPSDHLSSFGGKDDDVPTLTEKQIKRSSDDENLHPDRDMGQDIALDINCSNVKEEHINREISPHATSPPLDRICSTVDSKDVKVVADANTDVAEDVSDIKEGSQGEDEMNIVPQQQIHHAGSSDADVAPTSEVTQKKNLAACSSSEVATGDTCEAPIQLSAEDPPEEMPSENPRPSSGIGGRFHGSAQEGVCEVPDPSAPPLPSAETNSAVAVPIGLDANDAALPVADVVPIIDNSLIVPPRSSATRNDPSSSPRPPIDNIESGSRQPPLSQCGGACNVKRPPSPSRAW